MTESRYDRDEVKPPYSRFSKLFTSYLGLFAWREGLVWSGQLSPRPEAEDETDQVPDTEDGRPRWRVPRVYPPRVHPHWYHTRYMTAACGPAGTARRPSRHGRASRAWP